MQADVEKIKVFFQNRRLLPPKIRSIKYLRSRAYFNINAKSQESH
jgi:hypothetical protein